MGVAWPTGKGGPTQHSASSPMGPRRAQARRPPEGLREVGLSLEPGATGGSCLPGQWPNWESGASPPFHSHLLEPDKDVLKESGA